MANLEEIAEHVDRRLEELHDESTRLRAALQAIGRPDAPADRRLHARHTAKPAVKTLGRGGPTKPTSGSSARFTEPNAAGGVGRDAPVERAIRQLRQELAAGLRG